MACKTIQCVSVPNLKVFGSIKTEFWAKEVEEFSIMLYGKWTGGILSLLTWLPQYISIEIFLTRRNTSKWGYLHCVKAFPKKSRI